MSEGKDWFAPKAIGYGAGLPIAWQGWALLASYLAVMIGGGLWLSERNLPIFIAIAVVATAAVILISKAKTRGGWHWRPAGSGSEAPKRRERRRQDGRKRTHRKGRR